MRPLVVRGSIIIFCLWQTLALTAPPAFAQTAPEAAPASGPAEPPPVPAPTSETAPPTNEPAPPLTAGPREGRPIQIPDLPPDPRASSSIAYILRTKETKTRISDLEIAESTVPVVLISKGTDIKPSIALHGRFARAGWQIYAQKDSPLARSPDGQFTIFAHLRGRVSDVTLTAVGPKNELQTEHIYIYAPNARAFHVVSAWQDLLFSGGLTNMSYVQSGFGAYQSISALVSVRYSPLDSESLFDFYANAELMVLAFASSPISTAPQILEARGDLTIRTNRVSPGRYRTRMLLGGTYLTMFANGSPFGFADLLTPEAGVQVRYIANFKTDWIGEVRYMPIGGLVGFGQQGVSLSIARSLLLENSRRFEMGLSYSGYSWKPVEGILIETSLLTGRIGLTF